MKPYLRLCLILLSGILLAACSSQAAPPNTPLARPALPTANVPPLTDVDTAIQRWTQSGNTNYYLKVDEQTRDGLRRLHIVVANGKVRAALIQNRVNAQWSDLESLPFTQAENYTVDGLLARIRRDTLGAGPAPVNLKVVFDNSMGLPLVIQAEGLPSYAADGTVQLNRTYGYTIAAEIAPLLEGQSGNQSGVWLELAQGNGPQASCDHLYIFQDGSSLYTDDCRQISLPLRLPIARKNELAAFSAAFASLTTDSSTPQQVRSLFIQGSGTAQPDPETIQAAWALTDRLYGLLSYPLGAGITLIFSQQDEILGAEMLRQTVQPARIAVRPPLYGAQVDPQGQFIAISDAAGLQTLDPASGAKHALLTTPQDGSYYLPRAWNSAGQLLISQIWPDGRTNLGWVSQSEPRWHTLPHLPDGTPITCDNGVVWSPDGTQLAVSSLGTNCPAFRGLAIITLAEGKVTLLPGVPAAGHVSWSPGGTWLTFSMPEESGIQRVYVIHPDGSGLAPISLNASGTASWPLWASNDRVYYALQTPQAAENGAYLYQISTGESNLLIPGENIQPVSISPDGEFLLYRLGDKQYLWSFLREENMEVILKAEAALAGWLTPSPQK
ncbi:MAG: hypothetical protein Fur0018_10170 [Anaerolineales bacterium]